MRSTSAAAIESPRADASASACSLSSRSQNGSVPKRRAVLEHAEAEPAPVGQGAQEPHRPVEQDRGATVGLQALAAVEHQRPEGRGEPHGCRGLEAGEEGKVG